MKVSDAIAWFDAIARIQVTGIGEGIGILAHDGTLEQDTIDAADWLTRAESAIKSVFPSAHPICARWDSLVGVPMGVAANTVVVPREITSQRTILTARGIFSAAHAMLKEGRIASLLDSVRAETVVELLEQAESLLAGKYVAAATVTAGGALETHLRQLCARVGCSPTGAGSIASYRDALNTQRNTGNEIISAADADSIGSWGKKRNDAAHDPGSYQDRSDPRAFAALCKDVELMIEGVRLFVARTSPS